jgi:hypothetical protein
MCDPHEDGVGLGNEASAPAAYGFGPDNAKAGRGVLGNHRPCRDRFSATSRPGIAAPGV